MTQVDPLDSCAEVAFTAPYAPWSPAAFDQTGKAAMARTEITFSACSSLRLSVIKEQMKDAVCSATYVARLAGGGQNQTRLAGGRQNQSRTPARPCSATLLNERLRLGGTIGGMAIG